MPRPPDSDPTTPVHHCPQCRQTLTFHNARTEPNADGKDVKVIVYLCIHHGFYHVSEGKSLSRGM